MPWKVESVMDQRREFVEMIRSDSVSVGEACRRYGISRQTGHKWLTRYEAEGPSGLADRSRRPATSPSQTLPGLEARVIAVRQDHPRWGGRKIRAWLQVQQIEGIPSASTITEILRRHELLDAAESEKHQPWKRFTAAAPNELWQLDFKGHLPLRYGRVHPLSVLDDHSRFALGVVACCNERDQTVRTAMTVLPGAHPMPPSR